MAGYSQNDPRWSGDKLGTSTYWTMGAAGCFVTAGADVMRAFGHDITPGELNQLATSRGLIDSNGDIVNPNFLAQLFPDVCQYIETADWGSALADLHYFDIRNDLNTEIIVMIDDSPAPGMQTHFMRVIGWDGGTDVLVDDSWDAVRKGVSAYAARFGVHPAAIIYKAVKYVKVQPPAPEPAPETQPEPAPVPAPEPPVVPPTPVPAPVETQTPPSPPTSTPTLPSPSTPHTPKTSSLPGWFQDLVNFLLRLIKPKKG